jgi:hypothetical protein
VAEHVSTTLIVLRCADRLPPRVVYAERDLVSLTQSLEATDRSAIGDPLGEANPHDLEVRGIV